MSIFNNLGKQQPMTMQQAMTELRSHPADLIKQAGFNVPANLAGNPQATVMHLMQTGQIRSPIMQRIQPMLNLLTSRR